MFNPPPSSKDNEKRLTRISVNIPAEYQYKSNIGECYLIDISEGGLGIETNQIFVPGDIVRVKCQASKHLNLDIWCKVKNVQGRKIGMEFEEISHQQRTDLETYIYELLDVNKKTKYEHFNKE